MITLKTPFVWITIANIILGLLAATKMLFVWQAGVKNLFVMSIVILLYFGVSYFMYFFKYEVQTSEQRGLRRARITEGDKVFLEFFRVPIAYLIGTITLIILVNIVFFADGAKFK